MARQVEVGVVGEVDGAGSGGAGLVPAPQRSSLHQGFQHSSTSGLLALERSLLTCS